MASKLLNAVTADNAGTDCLVIGPCTIFMTGTWGGGTVSLQAARKKSDGTPDTYVEIASKMANAVVNDTIIGQHFLKAVLTGSTNPALTVAAN